MQKNLKASYFKLSIPIKSAKRIYPEKASLIRNHYQRDRDRIIHCTAFRRLKHKTQVFVNTTGDHYRTRITHSLEVSQIARTLAKIFGLNEDLCESLSLAHDLGHSPFGHAGEEALNESMNLYGGFDHNIQTLRIVTFLENKYYNFKGLNLCVETLDGLVKHNGPINNTKKIDDILGKNIFKKKIKFGKKPSLESQVASISDDIAYNSHDLEDGIKAKLFAIEDLNGIPVLSDIIYKHKKKLKADNKVLVLHQIVRDIINEMVKDIVINTKKNLRDQRIQNRDDIYKSKYPLVCFSDRMYNFDISIKEFLTEKMYYNKSVLNKAKKGMLIVSKLFDLINKKPKKFLNKKNINSNKRERSVCDFIAGMTDRYAINLFNSIK